MRMPLNDGPKNMKNSTVKRKFFTDFEFSNKIPILLINSTQRAILSQLD
jgi:hypothetical protein